MQKIKIAFFGSKNLGDACIDFLLNGNHNVEVVLIGSNSSSENWWKGNRGFVLAQEKGIPFIDNAKKNEAKILEQVQGKEIDFLISVQHPWIFSNQIIESFKSCINLHNAKLPDYKGYNACNHAILNNEKFYTTTCHHLVADVDAGNIIFESTVNVEATETTSSLYKKSNAEGFELFKKFIDYITSGKPLPSKRQTGEGRFYSRNSLESFRDLTDCNDLEHIDRVVRALYFPPFTGAFVMKDGEKIFLDPIDYKQIISR